LKKENQRLAGILKNACLEIDGSMNFLKRESGKLERSRNTLIPSKMEEISEEHLN